MEWTCGLEGCPRPGYSADLCEMHYRPVLRTGDPGPPEPRGTVFRSCQAAGCELRVEAKGYCHAHISG